MKIPKQGLQKKIEDVKKTEEKNKRLNFISSLKANKDLREHLKLALKNTQSTSAVLLPKIANSVKEYILEFKEALKGNTKTDEMYDFIQKKALTEHCYNLVNYNRKDEVNDLFEKVVSRANRLALMLVDYPEEFNIDTKTNKVFVMSKVLEPFNEIKIKGTKDIKKVRNDSSELLPVSTYVVDEMFKQKYPTKSRTPKNKDEKIEDTFKSLTNNFLIGLKKTIQYSSKKDVKFFDMVDDGTFGKLESIRRILTDKSYLEARQFSIEYAVNYEGNLEQLPKQEVVNK